MNDLRDEVMKVAGWHAKRIADRLVPEIFPGDEGKQSYHHQEVRLTVLNAIERAVLDAAKKLAEGQP